MTTELLIATSSFNILPTTWRKLQELPQEQYLPINYFFCKISALKTFKSKICIILSKLGELKFDLMNPQLKFFLLFSKAKIIQWVWASWRNVPSLGPRVRAKIFIANEESLNRPQNYFNCFFFFWFCFYLIVCYCGGVLAREGIQVLTHELFYHRATLHPWPPNHF